MVWRRKRKVRPNQKYKGYDSEWEYNLHQDLLKNWAHHSDKIDYIVPHTYEPDFHCQVDGWEILVESKGRFWDAAEYAKYIHIRKALLEHQKLVFLFYKPEAPMPRAKVRKDGTKRTHAEWAETNKFEWYSEETFPEEWI